MINYFPHFKILLLCRKKKCHHVSCPLQTAVNMIINFFDCSSSIHFTEFLMGSEQYDVPLCSIAWSYLTLCDPLDCSPPGSSVHGILLARILEWVACPTPEDLSHPGIKPKSLWSPASAGEFFTSVPSGKYMLLFLSFFLFYIYFLGYAGFSCSRCDLQLLLGNS